MTNSDYRTINLTIPIAWFTRIDEVLTQKESQCGLSLTRAQLLRQAVKEFFEIDTQETMEERAQ